LGASTKQKNKHANEIILNSNRSYDEKHNNERQNVVHVFLPISWSGKFCGKDIYTGLGTSTERMSSTVTS
jgi:hypothetical protein